MRENTQTVRRTCITVATDHMVVDGTVRPLPPPSVLGFAAPRSHTWGMRLQGIVLGQTRLMDCEVRPGRVALGEEPAGGRVSLMVVRQGTMEVALPDGTRHHLGPGQAWYRREGAACVVQWNTPMRIVEAAVPADQLVELGVASGTGVGTVAVEPSLLAPVAGFLHAAIQVRPGSTPLSAYFLERLTLEMVSAVMLSGRGADGGPRREPGLYGRAVTLMTARRGDAALTPESLAAEMNVSLRQLQREFQVRGQTVAATLRRLRVELAVQLLEDPACRVLAVEDIAGYAGFSSGHLLRRGLEAFGHPRPAEIRRRSAEPSVAAAS